MYGSLDSSCCCPNWSNRKRSASSWTPGVLLDTGQTQVSKVGDGWYSISRLNSARLTDSGEIAKRTTRRPFIEIKYGQVYIRIHPGYRVTDLGSVPGHYLGNMKRLPKLGWVPREIDVFLSRKDVIENVHVLLWPTQQDIMSLVYTHTHSKRCRNWEFYGIRKAADYARTYTVNIIRANLKSSFSWWKHNLWNVCSSTIAKLP